MAMLALVIIIGGLFALLGIMLACLEKLDDGPAHPPSSWNRSR
jgi:hypothetical protein